MPSSSPLDEGPSPDRLVRCLRGILEGLLLHPPFAACIFRAYRKAGPSRLALTFPARFGRRPRPGPSGCGVFWDQPHLTGGFGAVLADGRRGWDAPVRFNGPPEELAWRRTVFGATLRGTGCPVLSNDRRCVYSPFVACPLFVFRARGVVLTMSCGPVFGVRSSLGFCGCSLTPRRNSVGLAWVSHALVNSAFFIGLFASKLLRA